MKIKSIAIENVKSFREKVIIDFDTAVNIFVGPNAGGKSNLLDIITILMRGGFLNAYRVQEGQDSNQLRYKNIQQVATFQSVAAALEKYIGEEKDSEITVQFTVFPEDVDNLIMIQRNENELAGPLAGYRNKPLSDLSFVRQWDISLITGGTVLTYSFLNGTLQEPNAGTAGSVFLQYLRHYELFLILCRDTPNIAISPLYLYFPPYRAANSQDFTVNLAGDDYYNLLHAYYGLTSRGGTSSLVKIATLHFAQKMRSLEVKAEDHGYGSPWECDADVQRVTKYLKPLGYGWKTHVIDQMRNIYQIQLDRQGKSFAIDQASSGEREILNILFGIFAFNISNGLIIIDEPELHLHPKWQAILRDLFIDLARDTGNQFVITTHSPVFVSTRTIENVHRVYRDRSGTSCHQVAKAIDKLQPKDVIQIVNTQNNERMFFADKVVLVEGIKDRLVIETLLSTYHTMLNRLDTIEVLEVIGKGNFEKYKSFLSQFGVDPFIVTDLDYICSFGDPEMKQLFVPDFRKVDRGVLKDKKSQDRRTLIRALDKAITDGNLDNVMRIWNHIKMRHVRLKAELSNEERRSIETFIARRAKEKVFVLRLGEIEDYLPDGYEEMEKIPELIKDEPFRRWLIKDYRTAKAIRELKYITCKILEVSKEENQSLGREYRLVTLPPPMDA